jgi:hypothetical protein
MVALLRVLCCLSLVACAAAPRTAPQTAAASNSVRIRLSAVDGEALFTLAGGLKPVSEGFWGAWIDIATPDLSELAAIRKALAPWRNEELWADVHVMHQAHEGRRAARAYVVDRAALAALLAQESAFFAPYGILPTNHPAEVLAIVERMPVLDRHRGQGLLYGYPKHAIDFFVAAAESVEPGGKPLPRRFVQIPTFASPTGRFVYAVPKDAKEQLADAELRERAARILRRYQQLRPVNDLIDDTALHRIVATLRTEFGAAVAPLPWSL